MKAIKSVLAILISLLLVQNVIAVVSFCNTVYTAETAPAVAGVAGVFSAPPDIAGAVTTISKTFSPAGVPADVFPGSDGCTDLAIPSVGSTIINREREATAKGISSKELIETTTYAVTAYTDTVATDTLHLQFYDKNTLAFVSAFNIILPGIAEASIGTASEITPAASINSFHLTGMTGDFVALVMKDSDGVLYTLKFDNTGLAWQKVLAGAPFTGISAIDYNGPSDSLDILTAKVTDTVVVEIDGTGVQLTEFRFNIGALFAPDVQQAILVDDTGNFYLTGIDGFPGDPYFIKGILNGLAVTTAFVTNIAPFSQATGARTPTIIDNCGGVLTDMCFSTNFAAGNSRVYKADLTGNVIQQLTFSFGTTINNIVASGNNVFSVGNAGGSGEVSFDDFSGYITNWIFSYPAFTNIFDVEPGTSTEIAIVGTDAIEGVLQLATTTTGVVIAGFTIDPNGAGNTDAVEDVFSLPAGRFLGFDDTTIGSFSVIFDFEPEAAPPVAVPEFSTITMIIAVLGALVGIFAFRRRNA